MSVSNKFAAGDRFPDFGWEQVAGGRVVPAQAQGWRLLVVYRGKHCPICRSYLGKLDAMRDQLADLGVTIWAISADPIERAAEEARNEDWSIPILAGLAEDEMRSLGLYISSPRTPDETDRNFAEPAMFLIRPDGIVHSLDVASAPFYRPEPSTIIDGIAFIQQKDYPPRGIVD